MFVAIKPAAAASIPIAVTCVVARGVRYSVSLRLRLANRRTLFCPCFFLLCKAQATLVCLVIRIILEHERSETGPKGTERCLDQ